VHAFTNDFSKSVFDAGFKYRWPQHDYWLLFVHGVGYQVALAVQQKKPVLLLSKEGLENDSVVSGVDNTLVTFREYSDDNLEQTVQDFLVTNDVQPKDLRFNFFIDRQIYSYLRWASYKTGKPKGKILRELVLKEIDKN